MARPSNRFKTKFNKIRYIDKWTTKSWIKRKDTHWIDMTKQSAWISLRRVQSNNQQWTSETVLSSHTSTATSKFKAPKHYSISVYHSISNTKTLNSNRCWRSTTEWQRTLFFDILKSKKTNKDAKHEMENSHSRYNKTSQHIMTYQTCFLKWQGI